MKQILTIAAAVLMLSSCVSMREYEALQSQYSQTMKGWSVTKQELQELREENAELVRQGQAMTVALSDMTAARQECEATVKSINRSYAALQLRYDTTVENFLQQITGKNRDLTKANKMLEQRTQELYEREAAARQRQQQLEERQRQLEQSEQAATEALRAKEQELEQLRHAVSQALVGFTDKGLNVETKEGKVYVSMEDKLLFASGSWTVSEKGVEAIKSLAKVLEEHTDLNIMVEGHTDNVVFRGTTAVKDNWDLSVMRATAVVKALLQNGDINPTRLSASGRSEYLPLDENNTPEARAKNRRTEIILTPNLDQLFQLIQGN